jgi:hypothetical protein
MSDFDSFEFDLFDDSENSNSDKDLFAFNGSSQEADEDLKKTDIPAIAETAKRRTSADFSPDMDMLLITAQSSMILEGMKLISKHDFKSSNLSSFSEAVKGVDLYIKIIQRNPENFHKLSSMLVKDAECQEVQKITFNLYKSIYDELPESESQKLRAFQLIKETLQNGYCKSLISLSLIEIKKLYLMTGDPDYSKIDKVIKTSRDQGASFFLKLEKNVDIARKLLKSGNFEINKGMKGREINVFIVKASEILYYYYSETGYQDKSLFYKKLYENFKKYYVIK